MTFGAGAPSIAVCSMLAIVAAGACSRPPEPAPAKPAPAATLANARPEAELTTVTLSPQAVERLGIHTVAAAVERVAATRTLAGEIVVPEGKTVVVSAPVAGTLAAGPGGFQAGSRVEQGAVVFRLLPLASGDRDQRIEAERVVATTQAENEAATKRLQRLERLLSDGATSQRAVEEARAQQAAAAAAFTAAKDRVAAITRNPGAQGEIAIAAPLAGVLQSISAASGQTVAASAPLFTVAQVDTVWLRVPVYAGDAASIDPQQPASVVTLGDSSPARPARRVVAPPKADPSAASVDLFYELSAGTPALRPGERVSVQLPLKSAESGLAIPDSAIVYDIHGETWVYQDLGQRVFSRRRVEISRHVGTKAVVARGLEAGTRVVDVGAAELFGTEFGTGK